MKQKNCCKTTRGRKIWKQDDDEIEECQADDETDAVQMMNNCFETKVKDAKFEAMEKFISLSYFKWICILSWDIIYLVCLGVNKGKWGKSKLN